MMKRVVSLLLLCLLTASVAFADNENAKTIEGFTVDGICEVKDIVLGNFGDTDEKNCCAMINFNFANLSTRDCYFHDIVSSISLSFMGKYEFTVDKNLVFVRRYTPFNGNGYNEIVYGSNDYLLDPLCEASYWIIFYVPKVVSDPDKELTMVMEINGETYEATLR